MRSRSNQKKVFVFAYECPIASAPFVEKALSLSLSLSSSEFFFFFLYYCQKINWVYFVEVRIYF